MNDYEAAKESLIKDTMTLEHELSSALPQSEHLAAVRTLLSDLRSDFYTVVVLGEFKRGKSTFINSLIGEDLLPVDVTPTTAVINAIMWGERRSFFIHGSDGQVTERELTPDNLRDYTTSESFDPDTVDYLRVQLPVSLLKDRVVLVDTPGVNDLNEQRMDVTYQFVPRADAVIFLLDATAPLKRSELDFINESLLKNGIDRLLFVANFFDQVDEDDQEELLDAIRRRLETALKRPIGALIPYSAYEALYAGIEGDEQRLIQAGYGQLEDALQELLQRGKYVETKRQRYRQRMTGLAEAISREIEQAIRLREMDVEEIAARLHQLEEIERRYVQIRDKMDMYAQDRKSEMMAMIRKSLQNFQVHLQEDIILQIKAYTGHQFKEYVETQIPVTVKRRMIQWSEQYMPAIRRLIRMLERELALALSNEFNTQLQRLDVRLSEHSGGVQGELSISADDISNTPILAGLLAGGAGAAAMLFGGPLLLPLVGMAGFPFLQKHMMQQQLAKAKEKLIPELQGVLHEVLRQFAAEIELSVDSNISEVLEAANRRYAEIIGRLRQQLEIERGRDSADRDRIRDANRKLQEARARIETIGRQIDT